MTVAPTCPVSSSQTPYYHSLFRGGANEAPVVNSIPIAFDLPSLIRTVNVMLDVLRSRTTSLTVNNLYLPRPPNFKKTGDKYYSQFPHWEQVNIEMSMGYVIGKKDKSSRAFVMRQNRVHYQNLQQEDPEFKWSYSKAIK
jgi:hypothetical protein